MQKDPAAASGMKERYGRRGGRKIAGQRIMDSAIDDIHSDLEQRIGYFFSDRSLLIQALTHRSFVNEAGDKAIEDNERLEFFGDAAIDFYLSDELYRRFTGSREGELTRIRASLVEEESLARLAVELDLGRHLRLGKGEAKSGGRRKKSILADSFEALVAAIYLDGGDQAVRRVVELLFTPLMESHANGAVSRDHKTEFQELSQAVRGMTPRYVLKDASGPDHDRIFTVEARIGADCFGTGSGRSKKEAEQAAAREGYARLKSCSPERE